MSGIAEAGWRRIRHSPYSRVREQRLKRTLEIARSTLPGEQQHRVGSEPPEGTHHRQNAFRFTQMPEDAEKQRVWSDPESTAGFFDFVRRRRDAEVKEHW